MEQTLKPVTARPADVHELRRNLGIGLIEAIDVATHAAVKDAIDEAQTVDDIKPVLLALTAKVFRK